MEDISPRTKPKTESLKIEIPVVDNLDQEDEEHEQVDSLTENHIEDSVDLSQLDKIETPRAESPNVDNISLEAEKDTAHKSFDQYTEKQEENLVEASVNLNSNIEINVHENEEIEITYDPTGTHILQRSAHQNCSDTVYAGSQKIANTEDNNLDSKVFVTEFSEIKNEEVKINTDDIIRDTVRPSDTVRPITHQRKMHDNLTPEEEDLGIYEDTAEGDDLTDTELEVLKSRFKSEKLIKEYEKVLQETEAKTEDTKQHKPLVGDFHTTQPVPEIISRAKTEIKSAPKQMHDVGNKASIDKLRQRGKTAVSCITDVFQESRNASRLALESREAMFRRAMTLLSARCTSIKQGLDSEELRVPFGVQVPKYFYVTQTKPVPMEPLKAWRGYNGNVYFEPIQVNPLKNSLIPDTVSESPKDSGRLSTKQSPRKMTESDKGPLRLGSESRSESRQTVKSSGSGNRPTTRQMAILDKQAVINRFNESLHEDIVWLEGQENTGSLAIRPRTQPNLERKKDLLYNKERICKGSVAHKLYVEKHSDTKRPRFSVSGGKFTPPNSMSPLLRTQTQYSLSNHRLTTNSPDLFHLNDSKLPPLDQIKASLKHSEGAKEKSYTRPVTITDEMKPFVKYSPDVVAKYAQQAL